MKTNKHNYSNYKLNLEKKFIFKIGSNLSFYLTKCFIDKYDIKNFKIIFTGQGGDRNKIIEDLNELCSLCSIDINKCLILNSKFDYNYFKMFLKSFLLSKKIKNFINCNEFNYVTSFDYGMINVLIKKIYKINQDYFIIDDGIADWITKKTRFNVIKSILYSLTLKKIIFLRKYPKKNYVQISSIKKEKLNNQSYIDISNDYIKFIKLNSKNNLINSSFKYNVLILCAKTIHYKRGVSSFVKQTIETLIKDNNDFNSKNTKFYIKLHPGYKLKHKINTNNINFQFLKNSILPIEFYDFKNINLVISPINTSIIYLNKFNLIEKDCILYYDIFQTDYDEKLKLINSLNLKKFNNTNYNY